MIVSTVLCTSLEHAYGARYRLYEFSHSCAICEHEAEHCVAVVAMSAVVFVLLELICLVQYAVFPPAEIEKVAALAWYPELRQDSSALWFMVTESTSTDDE